MFRCRPRISSRKHPGATLVEMLIAVLILTLMLFSLMAVILLTSRDSVVTKEVQGAYLTGLSELERREALRVSDDIASSDLSNLGSYTLNTTVTGNLIVNDVRSGDIAVEATWGGAKRMNNIIFGRQVSPSAWQNAGQVPPPMP